MMPRRLIDFVRSERDAIIVATLLAAALLGSDAFGQSLNDPDLVIQPYLAGLSQPTGVRFSGPGEGFLIEKATGQVKRFAGGTVSSVLDLAVQSDSERGLLGLELDPGFASNGFVYLYYSATTGGDSGSSGNWTGNRLVRYRWNGTALVEPGPTRTFGTAADGLSTGPNHDGGPLVFGSDGKLYGATGDLNRRSAEQNSATTPPGQSANTGGIYRLNSDLTVPSDNPFAGSFAQWYAYGVRNSFGIAVDPVTGILWDTENGPSTYDEINRIASGFNSGWVQIMGPDSRDPQGVSDLVALPNSNYSDPEFSFFEPIGITSIEFLADSNWGAGYQDGVLIGGSNGTNAGRLYLLRLNGARDAFVSPVAALDDGVADGSVERGLITFGSGFGVVTDLQVGPDGALYVLSLSQGQLYRIAPVPEPTTLALLSSALLLLAWRLRDLRGSRRA